MHNTPPPRLELLMVDLESFAFEVGIINPPCMETNCCIPQEYRLVNVLLIECQRVVYREWDKISLHYTMWKFFGTDTAQALCDQTIKVKFSERLSGSQESKIPLLLNWNVFGCRTGVPQKLAFYYAHTLVDVYAFRPH